MVRSGLCFDKGCASGIGFWGANGHDGIWHLSLINSLAKGSFENPVFAGEKIKNYHLGFDVFIAFLSNLLRVNPSILYFQVFPVFASLVLGFLVLTFVLRWKNNNSSSFWTLFLFILEEGLVLWLVF